MQNECLTEC